MKKRIYIAGPMRGYRYYNCQAFRDAAIHLRDKGWKVVSPVELDEEEGFDFESLPSDHDWCNVPEEMDLAGTLLRDLVALKDCDAIYLLHGWRNSKGANLEYQFAKLVGLQIFEQSPFKPMDDSESYNEFACFPDGWLDSKPIAKSESILEEAARVTEGEKQASYGPPDQDFTRTAKMWSALFGWDVQPSHVAMAMICLKMSRQIHRPKRDNWVDAAGYSHCGQICDEAAAWESAICRPMDAG
jgi:hypothetical protein